MEKGKLNWVFCDGYLPPKGDNPEFEGHEALMMTNLNDEKANIELVFIFEEKDPIGGYTVERVIHAPATGVLRNIRSIGDVVAAGAPIARIDTAAGEVPVKATIPGIIRGLIRDGFPVTEGFKIADIDPRQEELANCFTISDKARCIAGSVLEQVCRCIYG